MVLTINTEGLMKYYRFISKNKETIDVFTLNN